MSSLHALGAGYRMRTLLFAVALVPLLGLGWLSGGQIRRGLEVRSQLLALQESADRLHGGVELEIRLLEEHGYLEGLRLATLMGFPLEMLAIVGGDDLETAASESAASADGLLADLEDPLLAETVAAARTAQMEGDFDTASRRYGEALAIARERVVDASADLVIRAGGIEDGSAIVAMARVVEASSSVQAQQSLMALAYFTELVGVEYIEDVDFPLVRAETAYEREMAELQHQLQLDGVPTEVTRAHARLLESFGVQDIDARVAEAVAAAAAGTRVQLDLDEQGEAILLIAQPYLSGQESLDYHEALTDTTLVELGALVDTAWNRERTTNIAITLGALGVVIATIGAVLLVNRMVVVPLTELAASAERLRQGDGDGELEPHGPLEVRAGAHALNEAMQHIHRAERQALALAAGRIDDPLLDEVPAGPLGASLHAAVERLRESLAERERFRRRLAHEATHDGLTGLPNRSASLAHLEHTIARARRSEATAAVLFVDLDGFKTVNDQHGHQAGDLLLQAVARRLVDQCRAGDHVARLGGDEFLVVAEPIEDPEAAMDLARRLAEAVRRPIDLERGTVSPSACVGVAVAGHAADPDTLIRDADLAVYQAKAEGPGAVALCTDEMRSRQVEEADLEAAIRAAIENEEFSLHYQSTIDAGTSLPNSVEALVRWARPGLGMVRPDDFIPFAERTDLIIEIDRWVIERGISQLAEWHDDPVLGDLSMALNVSGRHLVRGELYQTVRGALDRHGVAADRLTIEVTESALLEDLAAAAQSLDRLRADGVRIAIDDFGTGYTSLAHLRTLPVDILKIDRSFVANLDNADDLSLVKLIVETGHLLGARVTAEGVETDDQASILRRLGSDTLQGYRFARPLTAAELTAAVEQLTAASV
ncbi:MAG: putative bifunctional diguanylate cyclase/phosphodiesterase [Acidimicrobiales bacterium]